MDYLNNVRALFDSVAGDEPAEAQSAARPRGEGSASTETERRPLRTSAYVIVFSKKKAQNA